MPTLNEAGNLAPFLRDIAELTVPHETIVADDESTDATTRVARQMGARAVVTPADDPPPGIGELLARTLT